MAQAVQPGPQQGRRFHVLGEHPPGRADKRLHTQRQCPGPDCAGIKVLQQTLDHLAARAIAATEGVCTFRMCQVQTTFASQQEFAPDGRHGIKQLHAQPRIAEHLGGHQTGRPTSNNGNGKRSGIDGGRHGACSSIKAPCAVKNAARTV